MAALPLWWWMAGQPLWLSTIFVVLVVLFSIWISSLAEHIYGGHDSQKIVIDEVAGMLVSALGVPFAWPQIIVCFALFRLFDATKPYPISWLDKNVEGGFGVVIDDVAAGAVTLACMFLARFVYGGWW